MSESQHPSRGYEDLWRSLAPRPWGLVAVVPAGQGGSTVELATALAEAGKRLGARVAAIAAPQLDPHAARDLRGAVAARTSAAAPEAVASARIVASVPPVLDDPHALAVARAADLVLVSVERGKTRSVDARRTIDLVGRDRVAGCLLLG